MSADNYYSGADLDSDSDSDDTETYEEPLKEWIGEEIIATWAGQRIQGVVVRVELDNDGHRFDERLLVSTGEGKATISVEPDDVLASMSEL